MTAGYHWAVAVWFAGGWWPLLTYASCLHSYMTCNAVERHHSHCHHYNSCCCIRFPMDARCKLYCFRDAYVAAHSSLKADQISINKFPFALYADVRKGEGEGVCPDADKSGHWGRGVNFCYIFADVFYGWPQMTVTLFIQLFVSIVDYWLLSSFLIADTSVVVVYD